MAFYAVFFGGWWLIAKPDRDMQVTILVAAGLTVSMTLFFAVPQAPGFVSRHSRLVKLIGIAVGAAGLLSVCAPLLWALITSTDVPEAPGDTAMMISIGVLMTAILIWTLPKSSKAYLEARERQKRDEAKAASNDNVKPSGVDLGMQAFQFVIGNLGPFLRIMGPWVVVFWAIPFAAVQAVAYRKGLIANFFDPVGTLLAPDTVFALRLIAAILVFWFVAPIVMTAWSRYILGFGAAPALPGMRAWRTLRILWLASCFFGALQRLTAMSEKNLIGVLGIQTIWQAAGVVWYASLILFVFLASAYALVFPAIAVDDKTMTWKESQRESWRLGQRLSVGVLAAPAPFLFMQIALNWLVGTGPLETGNAVSAAWGLVQLFLLFAALASVTTYWARIYELAKSADAVSPVMATSRV